jgi:COP9 signalosome complex subunit 1
MGYDDLGQHYHQIGDLTNSAKAYHRERDACTTATHVVLMYLRLIQVSIDQENWLAVQSNIQRIRAQKEKYPDSDKLNAKLSAAMGIALLRSGSYRSAADNLLEADPRMASAKVDDPEDEESYNEVITPNDIAVYGGLCALASMDRNELQARVLENSSFRNYLELEPHIRRAISFFVSSKFSSCLSILEAYKPDYLLDIHLQRHLEDIYSQIRSKAIQQYYVPFSRVTLSALATAFNTDEGKVESELNTLIKRGSLEGRVDLVGKLLLANTVDERTKVREESLSMAKTYEDTAHLRILRMQTLTCGLEVKAVKEKAISRNINPQDIFGNGQLDSYMMGSGPGRVGLRGGKRLG